jgi:hypothetical protein
MQDISSDYSVSFSTAIPFRWYAPVIAFTASSDILIISACLT